MASPDTDPRERRRYPPHHVSCFWTVLMICVLLTSHGVYAVDSTLKPVTKRYLCLHGSEEYQQVVKSCNELDTSYTGEWYCSKMEVCERGIIQLPLRPAGRKCMTSLGCAKKDECTNPQTNALYNGEPMYVNGALPGGMTIQPYCCLGPQYNNDDANIKYDTICNASHRTQPSNILIGLLITAFSLFICFI